MEQKEILFNIVRLKFSLILTKIQYYLVYCNLSIKCLQIQLHNIEILIHLSGECFYSKIQIYAQMICTDETTLTFSK